MYDMPETIMKLSDYNKMAKLYNLQEYSLNSDEYILVSNYKEWTKIRNEALKIGSKLNKDNQFTKTR